MHKYERDDAVCFQSAGTLHLGRKRIRGPTFVTVNPYTPGCYDTSAQGRETQHNLHP